MNNPLYINRIFLHPKIGRCDVTLRQGLNVIISEDVLNISENMDKSNTDTPKELRNSTGKTTFIHLIDYALGNSSFIINEYNDNKGFFEGTYVMAELSINQMKYTVKRSIIDTDSVVIYLDWVASYIIDDKNDQQIYKNTDLKGYISFLEGEIFNNKNYFNNKRIVSYRTIMNFIIRDQFFGFTNYSSGLKAENAGVSRKRLEFLFGLTTPEKLQIKEDISNLETDWKPINTEYSVLKKYLSEILKNTNASIKSEIKENEKNINKLRVEFNKYNDKVMSSERVRDEEKEKKNKLAEEYKTISNDITIINSRISNYTSTLNEIDNEMNKLNHISVSINILNPFKYKKCPIFMKDIKAEDSNKITCPFIEDEEVDKNNEIIEARKKLLEYEKRDLEKALIYLKEQLKASMLTYNSLKECMHQANLKIEDKRNNIISKRDKLMDEIKELEYRNKTLENQISQYAYLSSLQKARKDKSEDIKIKKAELNKLGVNVIRINEIYNEVVGFLSRNSRDGVINSKNLEPSILFKDGQLDTGAGMKSIAIIAFDLTMLTFSLECKSQNVYIPYMNFLVHDSPKRNDIDVEMYKNVFDYIISLEEIYLPLDICFQYIITTLDISKKVSDYKNKYIRLTLDNSGDGGKLFGVKINI